MDCCDHRHNERVVFDEGEHSRIPVRHRKCADLCVPGVQLQALRRYGRE